MLEEPSYPPPASAKSTNRAENLRDGRMAAAAGGKWRIPWGKLTAQDPHGKSRGSVPGGMRAAHLGTLPMGKGASCSGPDAMAWGRALA